MSNIHKDLPATELHSSVSIEFTNSTARLGFAAADTDVGRIVRQTDNDTFYILKDDSPLTWIQLGAIVGSVTAFAGPTAPSGWLLCDGTSYTTASQTDLFDVIAYAFGGSGANFNVPDLRSRLPLGAGAGPGLTSRTLAATGGAEDITDVAAHVHEILTPADNTGAADQDDPIAHYMGTPTADIYKASTNTLMGTYDSESTGTASVDVMNPFAVLNYIIKS